MKNVNKVRNLHTNWNHFFKIIFFNLRRLSTSLATYIIPLAGFGFFSVLILPQILIFTDSDLYKISTWTFGFIFFISLAYLVYLVSLFFKKTQEEGLTLIFLGKGVGRKTFIFANLASLAIGILFFSMSLFFWVFLTSLADSGATNLKRFNFSMSIFIATLVIMEIAGCIIILFSLFLKTITFATVFLIAGFAIPGLDLIVHQNIYTPFTSADFYKSKLINKKSFDEGFTLNDGGGEEYSFNFTDLEGSTGIQYGSYQGYKKKEKTFQTFAWLDPWYQFADLYTSLYQSNSANDKKWSQENINFKIDKNSDYVVELNGQKYAVFERAINKDNEQQQLNSILSGDYDSLLRTLAPKFTNIKNWHKESQWLWAGLIMDRVVPAAIDNPDGFWQAVLESEYNKMNTFEIENQNKDDYINFYQKKFTSANIYDIRSWEYFNNLRIKPEDEKAGYVFPAASKAYLPVEDKDLFFEKNDSHSFYSYPLKLIPDNSTFSAFQSSSFINIKWIITIWCSISLITTVSTLIIFSKLKIV